MSPLISGDRLRRFLNRTRERLWVKPLAICVLSIGGAFTAKLADSTNLGQITPDITAGSIEGLLSVMAASMLVIATFAVGSMVSAFASASSSATPGPSDWFWATTRPRMPFRPSSAPSSTA